MTLLSPSRCDQLVQQYRHLVPLTVKRLSPYRDAERNADLLGVAGLALVQAARRFDPSRGPFQTYALTVIRAELRDALREGSWEGRRIFTQRHRWHELQETLGARLGRRPEDRELAAAMGLSLDEYYRHIAHFPHRTRYSLDQSPPFAAEEDLRLEELIPDPALGPAELVEEADRAARVREALSALPSREQTALRLRFWEEAKFHQIAQALGLSEAGAHRLCTRALARLKELLTQKERAGSPEAPDPR